MEMGLEIEGRHFVNIARPNLHRMNDLASSCGSLNYFPANQIFLSFDKPATSSQYMVLTRNQDNRNRGIVTSNMNTTAATADADGNSQPQRGQMIINIDSDDS